jgi:membrane protein YqaA with SNARE-associated domain
LSAAEIGEALGVYAGTFVVCFLAGLIPLINAELWLIAVTLMIASPAGLPAIVVLAALGQMVAKVLLYYAALGAVKLPGRWLDERLARARAQLDRWRDRPRYVLWASATLGLPPFYVISLLAGALEIRLRTFCVIGMTGRVIRFSLLVVVCSLY